MNIANTDRPITYALAELMHDFQIQKDEAHKRGQRERAGAFCEAAAKCFKLIHRVQMDQNAAEHSQAEITL